MSPEPGRDYQSSRNGHNRTRVLSVFDYDGIRWVTHARRDRRGEVKTDRLSAFQVAYPYPVETAAEVNTRR